MSIHTSLVMGSLLLLAAFASLFGLCLEEEAGQGAVGAASFMIAIWALPSLLFLALSEMGIACSRYFRRGAAFRLIRWLSMLAAMAEAVFIILHGGILLQEGLWGWLPCHILTMALGILWFCSRAHGRERH